MFPVDNTFLYADQLHDTLNYMHENRMYKEMVMYIEACESGSLFEGILQTDIEIYALTAADADEPSWSTYCFPNDKINGTSMGTCLGDMFSVNWIEDVETSDPTGESL